jgi:SAM-dependent methyltransferase
MRTAYAFPNDWQLARRRLELLEACYDGATFRRAEALGVARGWQCLDAGAGGGSFARWLAARVGPSGAVVAADIDVRLLEDIDGVDVRRMDLTTEELPQGAFDFVHSRLLLIHLPSREQVLRRLVAALRPGGLLMVEEDDVHPVLATASGDYREAWRAFLDVTRAAGVDAEWARELPQRLDRLGLADVDAEIDSPVFRGGSDAAEFWSLTWLQVRDDAGGVQAQALDRGRVALDDQARWFLGPARVIAWGRRRLTDDPAAAG